MAGWLSSVIDLAFRIASFVCARITSRHTLHCMLVKRTGGGDPWSGEAQRNPEGSVAAQDRQDGGRHRPFSDPRAVSVNQVVSRQVLCSLFVVQVAW